MKRLLPRRITPRLVLAVTFIVTIGWAISDLSNVVEAEGRLVEEKIQSAGQLSRSITSATWHAMRAGHKDDAYAVMETMGEHQGVDSIRIFAKEGRVAFSSDPRGPRRVELDAVECRGCHDQDPPRSSLAEDDRVRTLEPEGGPRLLALLTPIPNEPACSTADCHAHPETDTILGVLDVALSLEDVDHETARLQRRALLRALVKILVLGTFITFFIHRHVGRPINQLMEGARRVGRLELDEPIEVHQATELGDLARAFDEMRARLRDIRAENLRFTHDLERQVEERSHQLQQAREKLIQSDRLASLGQLSASVAHEVNNPISAVLNLSMFLQRILTEEGIPDGRVGEFRRHLGQIADETERVGRIVSDLLAFSRRSTPQRNPTPLHEILRRTVALVRHGAELANVQIVTKIAPNMPQVPCDRSQIEQVVLNLLLNAIEAMPDGGRITVRAGVEDATDSAVIQIEDTGAGIARAHLARIFDPFFSTKEAEKGVGLGLAVAYGIVEAHDGRLDVSSDVGRGTTFTLRLPLHPSPLAATVSEETS